MDIFDRVTFYFLIVVGLSLGPLIYSDLLNSHIDRQHRIYAAGNLAHYSDKDPQDKNSAGLYWFIQTLNLK